MGGRVQKQAKPKIRSYPLQHILPPRQKGIRRIPCGHIQRASVKHYAHQISESVSLIPCHCHKSWGLRTLVKFPVSEKQGRKECKPLPHRVSLRSREVHARRIWRGVDCPKGFAPTSPSGRSKATNSNTHFLRSFSRDLKKGLCIHSWVRFEVQIEVTYGFGPIP